MHSRGKTPPSRTHDARLRPFRSRIFPRGTCWTFHAANPVVAAVTSISATNAGQNTPLVTVPQWGTSSAMEPVNRDLQVSSILLSPPVTLVKVDRLDFLLQGYQSHLATYLVNGFRYGFRIQFIGDRTRFESPNLKSALQNPDLVMSKLQKETTAGRIAGPFTRPPFPDFNSSPIGIVPKKTPNEVRLIHHLSYPSGFSVNDSIPSDCSTVHYATVNQAVKPFQRLGVGWFLAKTDIKSAFRIIPVHPQDYPLLGIKWADNYYFDRCLPMGCSSSCAIFEAFRTSLECLSLHKFKASAVLHILDNLLFVASSLEKCHTDLANFLHLCDYLGVPIAHEKTVEPKTTIEFAGITIDSISQEARLPPDNLQKCRTLLHQFYKRRTVTLREPQSLIGLLNFACSVVVPGSAFFRRFINLTIGIMKAHHHIRLTRAARADIKLWLTFLDNFNGRAFFLSARWETSATLQLYTDAAGLKGSGAVFGSRWFYGAWPGSWRSLNITCLELFPITLAVHIWGRLMTNQCVVFFTDNSALVLVDILNKQSSKHTIVMTPLRPLILCCLRHNIFFKARHVPGLENSRADFISRFQIDSFKAITPDADPFPTPVPTNLLPESWSLI